MNKSVFVPGHVTGFFNIENHEISLKNGSCGAGFLLSRGVKTTISPSDKISIDVNQGDEIVIEEVLKILEIDDTFKITQDIQLPIGAGFGTSAASAFSLTLAINEFLNLGYSQELCGQIAHMAEINLGAGLGDVVFIAYKTFGTIKTSDIISDPHHREVLSQVGLKYLELFEKETTLENFLSFSNSFSIETELMSDEVRNLVDYFNSSEDILGSSMAMLGNTVFAFAYDEDAFKDLDIEDLHICELNNIGIVYD